MLAIALFANAFAFDACEVTPESLHCPGEADLHVIAAEGATLLGATPTETGTLLVQIEVTADAALLLTEGAFGAGDISVIIDNDHLGTDEIAVIIDNDHLGTGEIAVNIDNSHMPANASLELSIAGDGYTAHFGKTAESRHLVFELDPAGRVTNPWREAGRVTNPW